MLTKRNQTHNPEWSWEIKANMKSKKCTKISFYDIKGRFWNNFQGKLIVMLNLLFYSVFSVIVYVSSA